MAFWQKYNFIISSCKIIIINKISLSRQYAVKSLNTIKYWTKHIGRHPQRSRSENATSCITEEQEGHCCLGLNGHTYIQWATVFSNISPGRRGGIPFQSPMPEIIGSFYKGRVTRGEKDRSATVPHVQVQRSFHTFNPSITFNQLTDDKILD